MRQKISAHVDGGLSGGSRVRIPVSEDPPRRKRKFPFKTVLLLPNSEKRHKSEYEMHYYEGQAGAELCQAQEKLRLAN